jgi:hypothetical protein
MTTKEPSTGRNAPRRAVHLVLRRFLVPLVVAVAALNAAFLIGTGAPLLAGEPPLVMIAAATVGAAVPIGAGILFIGLPAGLLVARLRWGVVESLAVLVAIGFALPAGAAALLFGVEAELLACLAAGLPGAGTAAIWTIVNHELFRRYDGA